MNLREVHVDLLQSHAHRIRISRSTMGRRRRRPRRPAHGGHERSRRRALSLPRPRRGCRGGRGRPPRRPRHPVRRARRPPRGAFRPHRRRPHPPGLVALGPGLPEPPARRLRLRRVGCGEAHALLRTGPRRCAAFLLLPDPEGVRLRQRRGSRPRHAGGLRRAGRGHRGGVPDWRRLELGHPHVLQGSPQAAARPYAHHRGRMAGCPPRRAAGPSPAERRKRWRSPTARSTSAAARSPPCPAGRKAPSWPPTRW